MPVRAARRETQRRRSVTVNRIKYTLGPLYDQYASKITEEFIDQFSEINHADHTKVVEMIEAYNGESTEIRYDAQSTTNTDIQPQLAAPEPVYPKAPEIIVEPVVQEQKADAVKMLSSCNGDYNTTVSTKLNPYANIIVPSFSDYVPSRGLCIAYANTGKVATQPVNAANVRLMPVQNKFIAA